MDLNPLNRSGQSGNKKNDCLMEKNHWFLTAKIQICSK